MGERNITPIRTLILCVGLPRSGKSTWAKQTGYPVVNPDSIRLAIHGQPFLAKAEPLVWATARLMVRSLFYAGHATVVLDATNLLRSRRSEWTDADWEVVFKTFDAPVEVCTQRAKDSHTDYLIPVIERMARGMEPLTKHERLMMVKDKECRCKS